MQNRDENIERVSCDGNNLKLMLGKEGLEVRLAIPVQLKNTPLRDVFSLNVIVDGDML